VGTNHVTAAAAKNRLCPPRIKHERKTTRGQSKLKWKGTPTRNINITQQNTRQHIT
jgi:hypothetical protein